MRTPKPLLLTLLVLAAVMLGGDAMATRNSLGTYTLPIGNPVVSGTTITSTWANNTMSDIGLTLTSSLDRAGRGGMTAPLKLVNGTVSAPALAWPADTNSGLYRAASHDVRMCINGTDVQQWESGGTSVTGTLDVSDAVALASTLDVTGAATITGLITGSAGATITGNVTADGANANSGTIANSFHFGGASSGEAIASKRTSGGNQFGIDFYAGGVQRMSINGPGGVQVPGSTATHPGTSIGAIYMGTFTPSTGTVTAGNCNTSSQTLAGVAAGAVCHANPETDLPHEIVDCYVGASDTVTIRFCFLTAAAFSGTPNIHVVVFQP